MTWVEIVAVAALAGWVCVTLDRSRSWPTGARLPIDSQQPISTSENSLAVIVPARNEADLLPETLTSLLRQQIEGGKIYLVDDGSSDDTAAVARSLSVGTGSSMELEVLKAGPRPPGWSGKIHALEQGYQAVLADATRAGLDPPKWVLLTDADIYHRNGSIASLLLQAEPISGGDSFDLVSVMARLRADSFWERVIIPAFVFFFQLLFPFRRVARPRSRVAAAAGGCVLVRLSVLQEAGGLAGVRGEIIDDVALAKAVKGAGGRTWLGFDPGICSLRSYSRLSGLWAMVSRTAFTQLRHSLALLLLTQAALAVFVVSPPIVIGWVLSAMPSALEAASISLERALVWATLTWGLMGVALLPAVRYHRVPVAYSLSLPLAGFVFALMTTHSAWNYWRGAGSSWRGRRIGRL